jgi:hypothetical protein
MTRGKMEMAVARTVRFAYAEGRKDCYAVITSLEHAVLLQMFTRDGTTRVKHTDPIVLFDTTTSHEILESALQSRWDIIPSSNLMSG